MNIFFLDVEPRLAALYHNDVHVIKMILESAQLLSTAHQHWNNGDISTELYRPTHIHHPCTQWLMESTENYRWLYELFVELEKQYEQRFGKKHKSYVLLRDLLISPPAELPEIGMTPVRMAMPDQYKQDDPVEAYREYYRKEKAHLASWRQPATIPPWFIKKD